MEPTGPPRKYGTNESGLGTNIDGDHEINPNELVDLNLSALLAKVINNVTINLESLQAGEGYEICKSNVMGSLSGSCITGGAGALTTTVNVSFTSSTDILSITAINADGMHPAANLLIDSVTTPEPDVLTLFGSGLLCLGGLVYRSRKNQDC
jgi:hypothetical protein